MPLLLVLPSLPWMSHNPLVQSIGFQSVDTFWTQDLLMWADIWP